MGYAITIGSRELGVLNGSVSAALIVTVCGVAFGSISYDLFFVKATENSPLVGAFFIACVAIIVVVAGIGQGGYNLQNDQIREAEASQATEEDNRQFYKQACKAFAERYDLTTRQEEVLFYLGRGRNARIFKRS